ncbi:MAG: AAA family ATPase [Pseudonocardia sp.]|nr:AAA family ATPase [Pseudonocardia sp.]
MGGSWGGTTGPLLEREDEITAVDAAVRRVAGGEGVVVLLEGPAGIGKTGLLVEVRRRAAAAGLRVLAAPGLGCSRVLSPGPGAQADRRGQQGDLPRDPARR